MRWPVRTQATLLDDDWLRVWSACEALTWDLMGLGHTKKIERIDVRMSRFGVFCCEEGDADIRTKAASVHGEIDKAR